MATSRHTRNGKVRRHIKRTQNRNKGDPRTVIQIRGK